MKKFKKLIEEVLKEGYYEYPGDDMTQKELKIAINAAKNILDMIEEGSPVQRWQISAIVKASEELASVCTSMRADQEEDDDWEDDYEEDEPMYIGFEYPRMYGEEVEQLFENPWNQKFQKVPKHDMLPTPAKGTVPKHGMKFKEGDIVVPHTGPHAGEPHKVIHAKKGEVNLLHPDIRAKYNTPMVRAKHEHLSPYKTSVKEEADVDESSFVAKAAHAKVAGKKTFKLKGSDEVYPVTIQHHHARKIKKAVSEELEEGYNDPVHREHISDAVHKFVEKDDPRHDKIVDHLYKAKNFGNKTAESLEGAAGISIGAAMRITKAVGDHMKTNFGTPNKTQTQAQRISTHLKQKWVKPR